jgi:hypothetical protein
MTEYISVDKQTLVIINDAMENNDGVVKTMCLYRWNEEFHRFELVGMYPLKVRA